MSERERERERECVMKKIAELTCVKCHFDGNWSSIKNSLKFCNILDISTRDVRYKTHSIFLKNTKA